VKPKHFYFSLPEMADRDQTFKIIFELCEYITDCPDCDMSMARKQTFSEWIDHHLEMDGPPEGLCKNGKLKRIFIPNEDGKQDKCCCEPRNSPFIFASET
jgi:hypothetical protein